MNKNEEIKEESIIPENIPENVESQTKMPEKKKKGIFGIILSIISLLIFIFIIFETIIAFMNFNLIKNDKEPEYFVTTIKETEGETEYTIYDMGLYKIIRKDTVKNYEITLLPFFLDYK